MRTKYTGAEIIAVERAAKAIREARHELVRIGPASPVKESIDRILTKLEGVSCDVENTFGVEV